MKKLLLIMLLTFTTIASADAEKRFTIFQDNIEGLWVFDSSSAELKYCRTNILKDGEIVTACTAWSGEFSLTMPK